MTEFAIQTEALGKCYRVTQNTEAGTVNGRSSWFQRRPMNDFWALRDVSFTVRPGEAVGIIGRNGAGKSTLLKLLSRITAPTQGRARISGRVGTLLEVGTGFHPELTGRENIFLSGTILGMGYGEVARKFDEIVAFSEVEKFIDTPVKRYSSGMFVRLAFAVASFLEPEILVLDEVLAVGDVGFQRKSLGRLNEVSKTDGRTVLFVSHDLRAIRTFCKRVLLLERGQLVFDGSTSDGIAHYLGAASREVNLRDVSLKDRLNRATGAARFMSLTVDDARGNPTWEFADGEDVRFRFDYQVVEPVRGLAFLFYLSNSLDGQPIWTMKEVLTRGLLNPGTQGSIELRLPKIALRPGEFSIRADLFHVEKMIGFDVVDSNVDLPHLIVRSDNEDIHARMGVVSLPYELRHGESGVSSSPDWPIRKLKLG